MVLMHCVCTRGIPEEISKDLKSEDYSDSGSDDEHAGHNVQISAYYSELSRVLTKTGIYL